MMESISVRRYLAASSFKLEAQSTHATAEFFGQQQQRQA